MILCCGEALIDMIPFRTENGQDGFLPKPGGAVFNTAIALGRLGAKAGFFSGLSRDLFGQQLKASLLGSHVDTSFIVDTDRPTTLAFVQITDGHATYTFFDENSAGRMITPGDLPELTEEVTSLYFGGISLACEPGAKTYASLIQGRVKSTAIMLDPNVRPGLANDVEKYRNRLNDMISLADIVKVSDEDLNWIYPGPGSLAEKIEMVRSCGPSIVILTRGSEGAVGFLADKSVVEVKAKAATVVDTVGAGDSFNAGVLSHFSERGLLTKAALKNVTPSELHDALSFGAEVSAVTVSRAGANPPWRREIV